VGRYHASRQEQEQVGEQRKQRGNGRETAETEVRPLQESRPHLVAAGSQAGVSLPRMPVPEMFPDRRTAASDGRAGKP